MKLFKASIIAAALLAPLSVTSASAGVCNVVANHVTGNGNFVDIDVSGCGYVSNHMRGSYSFAEIINRLGSVVTGIYGDGHYYSVRNLGDNKLGIVVDGNWHVTQVYIRGDGSSWDSRQTGPASSITGRIIGNNSSVRIRTH